MPEVDDYFAGLEPPARAAFEHVRTLALEVVPEAGQGTTYGMAALTCDGKPLLAFRAAKEHLSVFPCSGWVVDAVRDRLQGYSLARGTVRFTPDYPLPDDVVRDLVATRVHEIRYGRGPRQP
jgi:uncharacterized protein YdhG (YjbR/CyaY superfamily)